MKVLVVGSGAREHALVWKLTGERAVSEVVCAPGNGGIRALARCMPLDPGDPAALLALARREGIDLTIVGPELPLARGVADRFGEAGLHLFGPRREPARLESSKVHAKEFMRRHGVPTARFDVCETPAAALESIRSRFDVPVVVKADGLAAGKGVTVAPDRATAEAAVRAAMVDRAFGEAGARLVIEEHLQGQEVSLFAICDGETALPLPAAQDYKRAFDGDRGPNTGGMGAFAPSRILTPDLQDRVMCDIVDPVLRGLRAEGQEFRGFLYVGLMLTGDGPKVIEFNVRLGDPEAQVVLPMLESDLAPLLLQAAADRLGRSACVVREQPHVGIVLASNGYPGEYAAGQPIEGLPEAERMPDVLVFHAGTAWRDGRVVTAGGRVLTVVGRGATFEAAIARAYEAGHVIRFEGKQARTDIGSKALAPIPDP